MILPTTMNLSNYIFEGLYQLFYNSQICISNPVFYNIVENIITLNLGIIMAAAEPSVLQSLAGPTGLLKLKGINYTNPPINPHLPDPLPIKIPKTPFTLANVLGNISNNVLVMTPFPSDFNTWHIPLSAVRSWPKGPARMINWAAEGPVKDCRTNGSAAADGILLFILQSMSVGDGIAHYLAVDSIVDLTSTINVVLNGINEALPLLLTILGWTFGPAKRTLLARRPSQNAIAGPKGQPKIGPIKSFPDCFHLNKTRIVFIKKFERSYLTTTQVTGYISDPTYFVIAPRLVRAGQVYRVVINILEPSPVLLVRATLTKDNIEMAAVEHECEPQLPQVLEVMVPPSASPGQYRLVLEGNELGWLTGSAFTNQTKLTFSPRGATVLVQTNKPLYSQADTVRFRVVALDTAVKMVEDSVDVFILNPRGVLVRRWLSRQCREGPVSLEFPLSSEPEFGEWTIRVEASNSFTQHTFTVEEFHQARFEVEVSVPAFLSSSASFLEGRVIANYSSGAPVAGNVTVRASVKTIGNTYYPRYGPDPSLVQAQAMFAGVFPFKFRMSDFEALVSKTEGTEIRITATVGDAYLDVTQMGFAATRVFSAKVKLDFLGESPQVLRPAMPFKTYITASQRDGSTVPEWRLARHRLLLSPEVTLVSGVKRKLQPRTVKMAHNQYALWEPEIDLHNELPGVEVDVEVSSLHLSAELKDSTGDRSYSSLVVVAHHSMKGRHLQISTSTRNPKVGEYVILHVRSNYYLDKFRYLLLSKGTIIEAGQQTMEASLKTFPLPLRSELAGVATVVVYDVGMRGAGVVADALSFPVDALTRKGLYVDLTESADMTTLMLTVTAEPNSRVALAGNTWTAYTMQAGNDLTHLKILDQMSGDSGGRQTPLIQTWTSQEGLPAEVLHLPRATPGVDANSTFGYSDLLVLGDGSIPTLRHDCGEAGGGRQPCLLGGCYSESDRCDGTFNCPDRIDEKGCSGSGGVRDNMAWYRQYRQSRLSRHFADPWLWKEVEVDASGSATLTVPRPPGAVNLALTAFSLHPDKGMTILPQPIQWSGNGGFWLWVEAAGVVGIWEQVGVRVTCVNHNKRPVSAVITLANNPDYRFVNVNGFEVPNRTGGFVRRMVGGEHEHAVDVLGGESHTLYLPVVPVKVGPMTLVVTATLEPGRKIRQAINITVVAGGAQQDLHTSLLLDMANRAYFFTFMDVNISEGAVEGSKKAHVSVFGDTVTPALSSVPVTAENLLDLPTVGCEPVVFSFLLTVLQLKQWRDLEQQPRMEEREVFSELDLLYQTLLAYQANDGGFKYYRTSVTSSVWVTSLVLRALHEVSANFPHFLYIDPQVSDKAVRFILRQQASHGAWWEPDGEVGDRKLVPSPYSLTRETTHALNLSTTAHTMLNLLTLQDLPEPLDERVLTAIVRGSRWLEENLKLVGRASRPLEVALVALALHKINSLKADTAFSLLARHARQEVTYVYWGEDLVPLPSYRVESQRPHLQPRLPHRHDSGNVQATAMALKLYSERGELMTPAIVRWLHSQRKHDNGWMSTQDTLAAWEALQEYSRRESRSKDTEMTITVEPLHDHTKARTFEITPDNILHLQKQPIETWWGAVRVQGKGRGSAVLQLTSRYHVDDPDHVIPSPAKAFSLNTRAIWHGRNRSASTFTSCVRWIYTEAADASGVAVLQVTLPSGYGADAVYLKNYVARKEVPHLRRADFKDNKITFFFEKIVATDTCVEFEVERWFPVANLTKVLPVKIFEYYSPELYTIELLDMSSVTLDICQVCGSYQCPNCPVLSYYSSRGMLNCHPNLGLYTTLLVIIVLNSILYWPVPR
ncbi:unnamed protein product, partial [Meganyctiphanes norvegica]